MVEAARSMICFLEPVKILQKIVADIQNAESAVVELVYHTFL